MLVRSSAISRIPGLAGPAELHLGDRQPFRIVILGLEPVPVPENQHIQVTGIHIIQAAFSNGFTVGQVTVYRLMPRLVQPVIDRLPSPRRSTIVDDT